MAFFPRSIPTPDSCFSADELRRLLHLPALKRTPAKYACARSAIHCCFAAALSPFLLRRRIPLELDSAGLRHPFGSRMRPAPKIEILYFLVTTDNQSAASPVG